MMMPMGLLVFFLLLLILIVILLALAVSNLRQTPKRSRKGRSKGIGTAAVGVTPAGVALTCDGTYAYVCNNNNYGLTGLDSVSVVNTKCPLLIDTIFDASFNEPYTITIDRDTKLAYVTNSGGTTVTILDTRSNSVVGVISGFDGPSGFAIVKQLKLAYVNNYGSSAGVGSGNGTTVSVVDLTSNLIIATITVGLAPAALVASPDGKFVYVVNYVDGNPGTGMLVVISTATNTVVGSIASGFSGPFDLVVTPDGLKAYITNFGSNNFFPFGTTVSVVDLQLLTISKTLDVGIQPSGIAITRDGKRVVISNYNTLYAAPGFMDLTAGMGTLNIIDTKKDRVVGPTIAVGQSPDKIAIHGNHLLVVSNYTSNTVNILYLP